MKIEIITTNATLLKEKIFSAATKDILKGWEVSTTETIREIFLTPVKPIFSNIILIRLTVDITTGNLVVTPAHWEAKDKPDDGLYTNVLEIFTTTLTTHFSEDFTKLEVTK